MAEPLKPADEGATHSDREVGDAESAGEHPGESAEESEVASSDTGTGGEPLTPKPKAVVFDANLWGRYLKVKSLSDHAQRLHKSGIEVWIPTQVALEWAEHTHEHIETIQRNWGTVERSGIFDPLTGPTDVRDVATKAIAVLSAIPNVTVLDMTGDAAIAGIRDQILKTGPGTSKKGVKTGASDSSFVRDALAAANDDPARVLFVSGNREDVEKAANEAGHPHVNVCPLQDMYRLLFTANNASEPVTELVAAELLAMAAASGLNSDPHSPPDAWIDVGDVRVATSLTTFDDVTGGTIEHDAQLIGIINLEVVDWEHDKSSYTSTVEFTLLLLTNVTVDGYTLDQDGQVLSGSTLLPEMLVRVPFIADIEDMAIVSLQSNGLAEADPAAERWNDPYDALNEITDLIQALAGVTVPPDADWSTAELTLTGLSERSVLVQPYSDGEQWVLPFNLDGSEAVIACRYDPTARVWDGKEGFDAFPPYYLSSSTSGYSDEPFTALAAIWHHLVTD